MSSEAKTVSSFPPTFTAVTSCSTVPWKPAAWKFTSASMSPKGVQLPLGFRIAWYCATGPLVSTTICRLLPKPAIDTRIGTPQERGVPVSPRTLPQWLHTPLLPRTACSTVLCRWSTTATCSCPPTEAAVTLWNWSPL